MRFLACLLSLVLLFNSGLSAGIIQNNNQNPDDVPNLVPENAGTHLGGKNEMSGNSKQVDKCPTTLPAGITCSCTNVREEGEKVYPNIKPNAQPGKGKRVCFIKESTPDDTATKEQKFALGINVIVRPFSSLEKKVLGKSLDTLNKERLDTVKGIFGSFYDETAIDPEGITSFRGKTLEAIKADIAILKLDKVSIASITGLMLDIITGDEIESFTDEQLDKFLDKKVTSKTDKFFKDMADNMIAQQKELAQQYGSSDNAINTGSVILDILVNLVMAATGVDLDYSNQMEQMYFGQVKLPFCYMDRYFEFNLDDVSEIKEVGTEKVCASFYNGNGVDIEKDSGFKLGCFEKPKYDMTINKNNNFILGKKFNGFEPYLEGEYDEPRKDKETEQQYRERGKYAENYMIINATSRPELSWAQSAINSSALKDYFNTKDTTTPVLRNNGGLRNVYINRGDLRIPELNIFNNERQVLNTSIAKQYRINCTPSIVSIRDNKVLVQEYVIPRPGGCAADETAYCSASANTFRKQQTASNWWDLSHKDKNWSAITYRLKNPLNMKCSTVTQHKKFYCNWTFYWGTCGMTVKECYVSGDAIDYAIFGEEMQNNRVYSKNKCWYGEIINANRPEKAEDKGYYMGLNIYKPVSDETCSKLGIYY